MQTLKQRSESDIAKNHTKKYQHIPSDWHIKKLNNLAKFSSGKFLPENKQKSGNIPVYGGNGITGWHNEILTEKPTVVFGRVGAYCGSVYLTNGKSWVTDNAIFVKEISVEIEIEYLYRCLKRLNIHLLAEISAQPKISQNILKNIMIRLPSNKTEQQKISSIFSNVDNLIDSYGKAIDSTKVLKRGLMQKLLTKGIGHTKFKKTKLGEIPEEWKVVQIKDIVKKDKKVTYGIVQPGEFDPNGILLIRGQDYINGWVDKSQFFRVKPKLHKSYIRAKTSAGDILICIAGVNVGAVNQVPDWIEEANITQTTARISCDENKTGPRFVLYFLGSEIGRKQSSKHSKGSAQPGLNLDVVEKFFIPLPKLGEQQKIVSVLSNVDYKIQKLELDKSGFEALKKGLMQKLLTGQIRVKDEL